MKKLDELFEKVVDIFVCILFGILSIKKGGFYASDSEFYIYTIFAIFAIYGVYKVIKFKVNSGKINDLFIQMPNIIAIFLLLSISYILPIIFNKSVHFEDSINEALRYLSIFCLLVIVLISNNKKWYVITLILIGVNECFLGIDGVADRILMPYLKKINSGYLSRDLARLSGTIQYANTACIIIAISAMLLLNVILKKAKEYLDMEKIQVNKMQNLKLELLFALFVGCNICILLTESRYALICYILATIAYLILNKEYRMQNCIIIILGYVIAMMGHNNIYDLMLKNATSKIYFVYLTYLVLSILTYHYIIYFVLYNKKLVSIIQKASFKKITIPVVLLMCGIYLVLALNIPTALNVKYNEKENSIQRKIYGIEKNASNELSLDIKLIEDNSHYILKIYSEDYNYEYSELEVLDLYTAESYDLKFDAKDNVKRIVVEIEMLNGSVSLNNVKLNGKKKAVNYALINSELVFNFEDSLRGSTSIRDRVEYIKDCIKIWKQSKLIGFGGEAFKHKYREVQELEYKSTEAHSFIFQILVESGICGVLSIILAIFISIKNSKNKNILIIFLMFIIHSIFDLNFSYLISMSIFTILIGINYEEELKVK